MRLSQRQHETINFLCGELVSAQSNNRDIKRIFQIALGDYLQAILPPKIFLSISVGGIAYAEISPAGVLQKRIDEYVRGRKEKKFEDILIEEGKTNVSFQVYGSKIVLKIHDINDIGRVVKEEKIDFTFQALYQWLGYEV